MMPSLLSSESRLGRESFTDPTLTDIRSGASQPCWDFGCTGGASRNSILTSQPSRKTRSSRSHSSQSFQPRFIRESALPSNQMAVRFELGLGGLLAWCASDPVGWLTRRLLEREDEWPARPRESLLTTIRQQAGLPLPITINRLQQTF